MDSSASVFGQVHLQFKGYLVYLLLFYLLLQCFIEISVFNSNRVDPDQLLHSVASDPGLHCLPMSLLWDAKHKWLNGYPQYFRGQIRKVSIFFFFWRYDVHPDQKEEFDLCLHYLPFS